MMASAAPCAAMPFAIEAPLPRPAPVTNASWPFSSIQLLLAARRHGIEFQRQRFERANDDAGLVAQRVAVFEPPALESTEQFFKANVQLTSREGGADADVNSLAERHMPARIRALGVIRIRVGEHGFVAIGGPEAQHHQRTFRNFDVAKYRIARRDTPH